MFNNLVYCERSSGSETQPVNRNIIIASVCVHSIKSKIESVHELVIKEIVDVLLITEMWLKDSEVDNIWLDSTFLCKTPYAAFPISRTTRKGSGILLLSKCEYNAKLWKRSTLQSFEGATWKLTFNNMVYC